MCVFDGFIAAPPDSGVVLTTEQRLKDIFEKCLEKHTNKFEAKLGGMSTYMFKLMTSN